MVNKRGAEMAISTIIIIVLAVLVLVILIFGFTIGWSKVNPFISSGNNVKEIADQCNYASNTGDEFSYCNTMRTLKLDVEASIPTGLKLPSGEQEMLVLAEGEHEGKCFEFAALSFVGINSNVQCASSVKYSSLDLLKAVCIKESATAKPAPQGTVQTDGTIKIGEKTYTAKMIDGQAQAYYCEPLPQVA